MQYPDVKQMTQTLYTWFNMALMVGDTFQSYEEFSKQIKEFEAVNHVQLFHKDSRMLKAARKHVPKRIEKAKPSLIVL